ncbi:unnamed protein product [Protopolystoma xenopodis]|uniref:Uncharacterized protein n=1 Tax=Protopolystoma xenopodis TaxID=117903 RepID=A0A3S5ATV4_9PLAT|nr:unnamed protein product [Protopolystoma xenopodis]
MPDLSRALLFNACMNVHAFTMTDSDLQVAILEKSCCR